MSLEDIKSNLKAIIDNAVQEKYGVTPDAEISRRVAEEWEAIEQKDAFLNLAMLYDCVVGLKEKGYPFYIHGIAAASFILYLLGITVTNPLPPHYLCPKCKKIIWEKHAADGFDLPPALCPCDDVKMLADGHNIPWETFWGYDSFGFDIAIPIEFYEQSLAYLNELMFGTGAVTAEDGYDSYERENRGDRFIRLKKFNIFFMLPTNFCDLDYTENDCIEETSTVADGDCILVNCQKCTSFLPKIPTPAKFSDLIAAIGLKNAEGVWDEEAQLMVDKLGYSLSELITFREAIYTYLVDHGFTVKDALKGMRMVRTGRRLDNISAEMVYARDQWVLRRCKKIEYLPSKAAVLEELFFKVKTK